MPATVEHEAAQEGHTVGRLIIFAMLIHRHRLVGIRTRVKNGLQHLMLNRRVQLKQKLWSEAGQKVIREPPLEGWAGQRRQDLLTLLSGLNPQIAQLEQAVERAAHQHPRACLLLTQPGVGPIHGTGLCNHDGGCDPLPAWEAGCQLSGPDPERAQFE